MTHAAPQTFRSTDMLSALREVQTALGPEALVVSVRPVPIGPAWQVWRKPGVEVVALPQAGMAVEAASVEAPTTPPAPPSVPMPPRPADLPAEPAVEERFAAPAAEPLPYLEACLVRHAVSPELRGKLMTSASRSLSPAAREDPQRQRRAVRQHFAAHLRARPAALLHAPGVICLVGPSGGGKTSAAAKLVAEHANTSQRSVAWVCADTVRPGALALARAYTDALGVRLRLAYTPGDLSSSLEAEASTDRVVVDLPAVNPRREGDLVQIGAFLAAVPRRSLYLVAPATLQEADLKCAADAFAPFDLTGLILTKLDEASALGPVINLAWETQLPLAYLSRSPRVTDALEAADPGLLAEMVWEEELPS